MKHLFIGICKLKIKLTIVRVLIVKLEKEWEKLKFRRSNKHLCCLLLVCILTLTMCFALPESSHVEAEPVETIYVGDNTDINVDDTLSRPIDIGFNFNFYGEVYSKIYISSNGLLMFTDDTINMTVDKLYQKDGLYNPNTDIPSNYVSNNPNNLIAPFWDDLTTQPNVGTSTVTYKSTIYYKTIGESPNCQLIVQWTNMYFWNTDIQLGTFQAILNENTNIIQIQYRTLIGQNGDSCFGNSATVGIENVDGTAATKYNFDNTGDSGTWKPLYTKQAISFTPDGSGGYTMNDKDAYEYVYLTTTEMPEVPTLPTAGTGFVADGATNTALNLNLGWNKDDKADSYRVLVSTNSNFTGTLVEDKTTTETQWALNNLSPNTSYYWNVEAINSLGSSLSKTFGFTTGTGCPVYALGYPKVENASTTGCDLKVQVDKEGTCYYVVLPENADAPNANQVIAGQNSTSDAAAISGSFALTDNNVVSKAITGIAPGTAYKVYVVSKDSDGEANSIQAIDVTTNMSDEQKVQVAKAALDGKTLDMKEGIDSTVLPMAQSMVDAVVSGVTVSMNVSDNINVASDGTITYGSSKVTGNVTYTLTLNDYTQDVTASVVVPAYKVPGIPTNVNAIAGDAQAVVSFTAPAYGGGTVTSYTVTSSPDGCTVSGMASPLIITGLNNGTAYTFTVTATNLIGTGAASSPSVAVTPFGSSTINLVAASFDQKLVKQADIVIAMNLNGNSLSSISDETTPLVLNTDYTVSGTTITIKKEYLAKKAIGTTTLTFNFNAGVAQTLPITINKSSTNGGNTDTTTANNVDIQINGKTENAGTATTSKEGDKTITTISIDSEKLEAKLKVEGNNAVVTIPVREGSNIVVGELNGQMVKNMENKLAVLEIKSGDNTYTLPAQQINIDAVSKKIGYSVELKDIKVQIRIATPTMETAKVVENAAKAGGFTIIAPAVDFTVTCSSGDKTVEVSSFNSYVERTIAIPTGVDWNKITTGVVVDIDGTVRHVPTKIIVIDGKYYAKINSLTNSTYSVIWNPLGFNDVTSHWAKDAVNDMGSRMVVSGVGNNMYEPNRDITRAEFAAIVVRSLGLKPGTGNNPFTDVESTEWYCQYIETAYEYGIISGYGNGKFGPSDKITREQAMAMVARAMKITGLKVEFEEDEAEKLLKVFADSEQAAIWAKESLAVCVKAGVVSGKSSTTLAPKDEITRAEVAAIVQRLLQKSDLI